MQICGLMISPPLYERRAHHAEQGRKDILTKGEAGSVYLANISWQIMPFLRLFFCQMLTIRNESHVLVQESYHVVGGLCACFPRHVCIVKRGQGMEVGSNQTTG